MRAACLTAIALATVVAGCSRAPASGSPAIVFTAVPQAAVGGSQRMQGISGRVSGAGRGDRLVLYARSGVWWVQPLVAQPFTAIGSDGSWQASTHLGSEYAALLVTTSFQPRATLDVLPAVGDAVKAVAVSKGTGSADAVRGRTLRFSGYDWEVRDAPSDRGGANVYDQRNVHVDQQGRLLLRLARRNDRWTGAEVSLTRGLGYGTYVFVTADVSAMDPSAVLGLITWDDGAAEQNHRELDVEISRWGDPRIDNAQFVVQPYYVAANVRRFAAPAGRLTHTIRWTPGEAAFRTTATAGGRVVAQHTFTAGVPVPGDERVRIHLYPFGYATRPPAAPVDVAIETFQYLP